ncbi:hypothetical protein JD844_034317 [Phrynosoma platyrhinos]|uniref:Telomerase RNA component interacting RNase n=1 Tax=Phrynosoma platyrhinos TaxID=52577 RepID=A0ABQ7T8F8_PHRPL|nr:hypothetical protein JD844_034317 [Phrynosoma platyrhinos]
MEASGVAPIRAQYLSTKEEFHAYLDREGELQSGEDGEKDEPEKKASSDLSEPPPAKFQKLEEDGNQEENLPEVGNENKNKQERKRARGQNKSRPCMKPANYEKNRLCPSVVQVKQKVVKV